MVSILILPLRYGTNKYFVLMIIPLQISNTKHTCKIQISIEGKAAVDRRMTGLVTGGFNKQLWE